ncbi:MAG: protein translocase subunit SecD [Gammaproteobacteria bacterium]|nr:protein translocase subunit SecD [Gammaproteobacteria bacterium]
MRHYPLWKTLSLIVVTLIGAFYALPNLYGEQPAVQITTVSGDSLPSDFGDQVARTLKQDQLPYDSSRLENGQWLVRVDETGTQLKIADALKRAFAAENQAARYTVALNLAPRTPGWLRALGGRPMALGLDLRGGVHFLLQVDLDDAQRNALKRYLNDVPTLLRKKDLHYRGRRLAGDQVLLSFGNPQTRAAARAAIAGDYPELALSEASDADGAPQLSLKLSSTEIKRIDDNAVEQNLITLRNRVNQLGVAEPLVQRQGTDRIVVELPGVQDTTRVKELLGATATLEYRAVDTDGNPQLAASTGDVPPDDELFYTRQGHQPVLLKREAIAAGSEIVNVAPGFDQNGQPSVNVRLDAAAGQRMLHFTERNVGKPMAVLYKETQVVTNYNARGEPIRERKKIEDVINVATIQGVFGSQFQTTGVTNKEAHDLALLLKSGALAAPIDIVEERTVGPSLGADNIRQGTLAVIVAFGLVIGFMALYYRVFGLFADFALLLNLVLIVGSLSIVHATLTMPGIAGIVLTLGMAVDANVLINERIREELRGGKTPLAAMDAGYERAFLTIADSNVTTLIAAIVLFALGSGPVKGFAVTLSLGILTSMFTAIVGTRTLAHYIFRGRKLKDLPV